MTEKILIAAYLALNLTQSFQLYYFANKLREESLLLGSRVYESPWYTYSTSIRKKILVFILSSDRPLEIMIGNFKAMTLETFQTILNAAYSYFNLLRSGDKFEKKM